MPLIYRYYIYLLREKTHSHCGCSFSTLSRAKHFFFGVQLNSTDSGKSGFHDMAFNIIVAFGIGIHFLEVSYELYSSQNVSRRAKTNIADLVS